MEQKRVPNFSTMDKEYVIKLAAKYAHILEDKKTNRTTIEQKNLIWKKIEEEYNANGPSICFRSADSLKRFYENSKKNLRKKLAEEKKQRFLTGGGSMPKLDDPNETEGVLISILNEKTLSGLTNEFDSDQGGVVPSNDNYIELVEYNIENENNSLIQDEYLDNYMQVGEDENIGEKSALNNEGITWKKYKAEDLKRPLSLPLKQGTSKEINIEIGNSVKSDEVTPSKTRKIIQSNRRRPTQTIKTLTSSDVAEKYNLLLDRRLVLIEKQIKQADEDAIFKKEKNKLELESLRLDVEAKKARLL